MAEAGQASTSDGGAEVKTNESGSSEGQVQLSDVPSNVLRMIFARLDLPSKGKAVQVCKKWRDVAYEKMVWRNERAELNLDSITNRYVFSSLEIRGVQRIEINNLTDPGKRLRIMLRNVPSLLELHITAYYNVSDGNLHLLHKFPNLRKLELHYAYKITDDTLKVVGRSLRELTSLDLNSCQLITDAGIAFVTGSYEKDDSIRGNLKLQFLGLQYCVEIRDESLRMIATNLLQLTKLSLRGCTHITDAGVGHLTGGSRLDDIPGNRKLEHLDLTEVADGLSHVSLRKIANGLKALSTLCLCCNRAWSEEAFNHLASMASLRVLKMRDCNLKGEWLVHLVNSEIHVLDVSSNEVLGTEGLRHLSRMSHLKELDLTLSGVTDEGLELLSQSVSKIETLSLYGNMGITNVGLEHLTKMADLKVLDLCSCQMITAVGLLRFAELAAPKLSLKFDSNFQRPLDAFNQLIRKIEENKIGSEAWMDAVRKVKEIESLLPIVTEEQPAAE